MDLELKGILIKFSESGWDLIDSLSKEYLDNEKNKEQLIEAINIADQQGVRRQITIGCNSKLNFRLTSIRPRGLTGNRTFLSD